MSRVNLKPADLGESGWNAILPPRAPGPALEQDIECDYCIVGAGIAGLSAAHRLRQLQPEASVVLIDARAVAEGPAGRNSGYMIDLPHALTSGNYAGDQAEDQRQIRLNRSAIAFAADLAHTHNFDSETFDPCGKINAAATDSGIRHNHDYARHLERLGEDFELMESCQRGMHSRGYRPGPLVVDPSGTASTQYENAVPHLHELWRRAMEIPGV